MLFQIYGSGVLWQLLGWVAVFVGLVLLNEVARITKAGGIALLIALPAALTVYFIVVAIAAGTSARKGVGVQVPLRAKTTPYYVWSCFILKAAEKDVKFSLF